MEESLSEKNGLYTLPLQQKSKLKWALHILYGLMVVMFLSFILIPGDDQEKFLMNILFLVFAIFFGYVWLAMAFFKKPFIKITNEYLEYKWLFGHKVILLHDIYKVEFFSDRGVTKLGIWANRQVKWSLLESVERFFGRDYSASIVISTFQNIDFVKLRLTILSKAISE